MKVLLVDDDPVGRFALSGLLRTLPGVHVTEAADGLAAWELLEQGLRADVCCSDIRMPQLDGLALMDRLRAHPVLAALPVVLITGDAERGTVTEAIRRGAAGYIVKPYAGADARATVVRVFREARARRAERPALTRRRLCQNGPGLARLLRLLQADVAREASETASAAPDAARLTRLSTAARTLGLWHAASLLHTAVERGFDAAAVGLVLREVDSLCKDQMAWLDAEEPGAAQPSPGQAAETVSRRQEALAEGGAP